jgi:hypothetical protein
MFKAIEDVMDQINRVETSTSVESMNTPNSSSENLESYVNPDVDREKTIDITFGKVLSSDSFKGHKHVSSAENLRKLIYQLAENPNATFNR